MRYPFYALLIVLCLTLSSCTLFQGNTSTLNLPQQINQYAGSATASDAFGGVEGGNIDDQSPFAATGAPDVIKCADDGKAWTTSQEGEGEQWLQLQFVDTLVYASQVRIRESYNPGAIVKVELLNGTDFVTVWQGKDAVKPCPKDLIIDLKSMEGNISINMSSFPTDTIRITVDTDIPGFHEIDAAQLTGYEQKWYLFNNTLVISQTQ